MIFKFMGDNIVDYNVKHTMTSRIMNYNVMHAMITRIMNYIQYV